jgi:hypothetical protein
MMDKKNKPKRDSKLKRIRQHAKRRARQRFSFELTAEQERAIVQDIQLGIAEFVERQSTRVTVWRVALANNVAKVCYDSHRKAIITCLYDDDDPARPAI